MRRCALAFAREIERRAPDLVTTAWWKEERGEKVFIDYNQNARDRTIASAYSVRPRPDATVSAPVDLGRAARRRDRGLHARHDAEALREARRRPGGDRRHRLATSRVLLEWVEREEADGRRRGAVSAELPEDAGRAAARAAVAGTQGGDRLAPLRRRLGAEPADHVLERAAPRLELSAGWKDRQAAGAELRIRESFHRGLEGHGGSSTVKSPSSRASSTRRILAWSWANARRGRARPRASLRIAARLAGRRCGRARGARARGGGPRGCRRRRDRLPRRRSPAARRSSYRGSRRRSRRACRRALPSTRTRCRRLAWSFPPPARRLARRGLRIPRSRRSARPPPEARRVLPLCARGGGPWVLDRISIQCYVTT